MPPSSKAGQDWLTVMQISRRFLDKIQRERITRLWRSLTSECRAIILPDSTHACLGAEVNFAREYLVKHSIKWNLSINEISYVVIKDNQE